MILASCLICFEPFSHKQNLTVLSCGHIFHQECILKWFKTKMACPTCRKTQLKKSYVEKVFFDQSNNEISLINTASDFNENEAILNSRITKLQMEKKDLLDKVEKNSHNFNDKITKLELENRELNKKFGVFVSLNETLSKELKSMREDYSSAITEKVFKENEILQLKRENYKLNFINDMLTGTADELSQKMLSLRDLGDLSVQLDALSSAFVICQNEKNTIEKSKIKLKDELENVKTKNQKLQSKIFKLEETLKSVQNERKFDKVNLIEYEKYFKTANLASVIRTNRTANSSSNKNMNNGAQSEHSSDSENYTDTPTEFPNVGGTLPNVNPFTVMPPKPKPIELLQNLNIMRKSCTDSSDNNTFRMSSDIYKIPVKKSTNHTNVKILPIKRKAFKSQTNITKFFK